MIDYRNSGMGGSPMFGLLGAGSLLGQQMNQRMGQMVTPAEDPSAVSYGLNYQNSPIENDMGFLSSRMSPNASPEALSLISPSFVSGLAGGIQDAENATGKTAQINDMYRSPETQAGIFDRSRTQGFMAAPAGQSWHQAAAAADISRGPVLDYMRANTPNGMVFPFGEKDLVHVQMTPEALAQADINRGSRGAFTTTMTEAPTVAPGMNEYGNMSNAKFANLPATFDSGRSFGQAVSAAAKASGGKPDALPDPASDKAKGMMKMGMGMLEAATPQTTMDAPAAVMGRTPNFTPMTLQAGNTAGLVDNMADPNMYQRMMQFRGGLLA